MKKFWPLIIAIISILFFLGIVLQNQWQLKHSESIFVELQPVDPRSLIQGDYMVLNYALYWSEAERQALSSHKRLPLESMIHNQSSILSFVQLDGQGKVVQSALDRKLLDAQARIQALQLKNPNNQVDSLYPSSQSFLFAEGLASCYEAAKYAEFKVTAQGDAILSSLRGADLKALHCEQGRSWWQGTLPDSTSDFASDPDFEAEPAAIINP